MSLPKWATTVTPLSKTLALIIFITFPFIGFVLGMNFIATTYTNNQDTVINHKILNPTPIPIVSLTVHGWYLIAESANFKIYYSGLVDGSITAVVNKNTGDLYTPSSSCETDIPEKELSENEFYNKTIGIIKHGPYKVISNEPAEVDTFRQRYSSGGRYAEEGKIKLKVISVPFGDTYKQQLECNIQIHFIDFGYY